MNILEDIVFYSMCLVALAWIAKEGDTIGRFVQKVGGTFTGLIRTLQPRF